MCDDSHRLDCFSQSPTLAPGLTVLDKLELIRCGFNELHLLFSRRLENKSRHISHALMYHIYNPVPWHHHKPVDIISRYNLSGQQQCHAYITVRIRLPIFSLFSSISWHMRHDRRSLSCPTCCPIRPSWSSTRMCGPPCPPRYFFMFQRKLHKTLQKRVPAIAILSAGAPVYTESGRSSFEWWNFRWEVITQADQEKHCCKQCGQNGSLNTIELVALATRLSDKSQRPFVK